jgi:sugar/nucleoside kinase (ribokinase family)
MTSTLIVGGLTVDRFTDGTVAPGGSVLHSGLAAVAQGASLTTLTVAGDEPAARHGLDRLRSLGTLVCQPAAATTTYRHEERAGVRVLVLQARTEPIGAERLHEVGRPDVALVAPIADEVPASLVARLRAEVAPGLTVLLIQGWLRRLVVGEDALALPLDALGADQVGAMAGADAVVVSTEDLVESRGDPFAQAAALRHRAGARPIVLVTLGVEGYLLDDPAIDRVIASVPRRVVTGVPAVGAGDTFGAALAVHLARGAAPAAAADRASDAVIAMLEERRPAPGRP